MPVVAAHSCVHPTPGGHVGPPLQKNLLDGNLVLNPPTPPKEKPRGQKKANSNDRRGGEEEPDHSPP